MKLYSLPAAFANLKAGGTLPPGVEVVRGSHLRVS